jgi:hypothetical protein
MCKVSRFTKGMLLAVLLCAFGQLTIQAQTTGSIGGAVIDQMGAVVPGATVTAKGQSGQEFTVTTSDNGIYNIPAVASGLYTVTVTATGFKTSVTENVKVDVGVPATVDTALEPGNIAETVIITSGAEVLQTQTATIGTNITGRQITETPIASRDALDLISLLPGTNSVGAPRRSSVNGLPKGALSITIDGVDVQDNLLRSSDGFFTYVRPRIDAIEEVTVSTANPGAESSGDGAVQIKFVTRRGTNNYNGGLFWQHRNTALNANYFYNNRDDIPRQKIILNQYGGRLGGPLPFPRFGEGSGSPFNSGKDRAFFFVNYEQFRQPESQTRTRVILTPEAQAGNFQYLVGGQIRTANLFNIAQANNQLATPDPTINALLSQIRAATATNGTITPITNNPNRRNYNFSPAGGQVRKFLALRFDFNLTKKNSLEFVTNRQLFVPSKDFLNSQDERFPGFPSYTQGSTRNSYAVALRSTFGQNLVNEARFATLQGRSEFSSGISPSDFDFAKGFDLSIGGNATFPGASVTSSTSRNSYSARQSPTYDFTDSMSWIKGNHSIMFGGQYKRIRLVDTIIGRIVPSVNFGLDSTDPAFAIFANTAASLPGANATQLTEARNLYATLVGRVIQYSSTAYLTTDGTYKLNSEQTREARQNTYGLFVQDSWRMRPNFTLNYGVRWQPQGSYEVLTGNYARLNSFEDVYGRSGAGNLFQPGTLTGVVPTVVAMQEGESAYPADRRNFAPTIGAVWSPDFGENGFLRTVFGEGGRSVIRGGYSLSFVREGTALIGSILGANPGGNLSASRSLTIPGSFTVGTNLRDAGNPNLTPNTFSATPSYPITLTTANSANAFDPSLKTGSVHSFSIGYQREIDRNTVIEFRYVGNRGVNLFRQHNVNEFNTIENGFADEFAKAQANLYANMAAGRGATFAYFGPNSGTSQLPIMLSYFNTAANFDPANPARYTAANFANTTLVAQLSRNAANIIGFGSGTNFENNATRRANALANGRAANFFYVNPTTANTGAFIVDNSAKSWYDSAVIEVRRRLTNGLRFQANYVWGKAQSNSFQSNSDNFANFSHRENGLDLAKNVAVFDVRHAFKFDATYDLPFGRGGKFFSNANRWTDALIGGFSLLPTIRWQSGSPFSLGNVQVVGMTLKELQDEVKVYKGSTVVTFLPDDIILNTQKAFDIDVTAPNGYGTTFGAGGPTGRFLAPAGFGNCQQGYTGQCGFNNLILYGPGFFKLDIGVSKKFKFDERRNVEFRATFFDALNRPNFRVGGWNTDVNTVTVGGSTFGQLGSGSAYQDISTTNDPGGRLIDFSLRINF